MRKLINKAGKFILILCILSVFFGSGKKTDEKKDNPEPTKALEGSSETDSDSGVSSLGKEFENAVSAIGMNPLNVQNIKQIDNWASGTRYSFIYDGFEYKVYIRDNGEINSICTDNLSVKIYEKGYKPLYYKDFEPDPSILDSLLDQGLKSVSKYILNEETLKSRLGTPMFSRIYDYYSVSGEVVAKNEVDKEDYSFTVDFLVDGTHATVMYVAVNGRICYGDQNSCPEVQKIAISEQNAESGTANSIIICDGKLGEYGQTDYFDGEEYIRYYVPAGQYDVTCINRGGFYIEAIEIKKEDGFDTATIFEQYTMSGGDTQTITIEEGQCISMINNTEIELLHIY